MSTATIQTIITNIISVLTHLLEHQAAWRGTLEKALRDAQQQGPDWQIKADLYTALLTLLDGQVPALPANHLDAPAMMDIQEEIPAGGLPNAEKDEGVVLLITNTLALLRPEREQLPIWRESLVQERNQATKQGMGDVVALFDAVIGLLDAGGNPAELGEDLTGEYVQV